MRLSRNTVALGLTLFTAACAGTKINEAAPLEGTPVRAGQVIASPSGLFTITVPDDRWVRLKTGTTTQESDLEVYGATGGLWAVAYVTRDDKWSLDDIVDGRRQIVGEDIGKFGFQEERRLLPESGLPVSYARYSEESPKSGARQRLWVATVVKGNTSVELIASGLSGGPVERSAEQLAKSLRLLNDQ